MASLLLDAMRMPPTSSNPDETVRTILDRAVRRARRVSETCHASNTMRRPEPGPVERIDPRRTAHIRPTPQNVPRFDTYELSLRTED